MGKIDKELEQQSSQWISKSFPRLKKSMLIVFVSCWGLVVIDSCLVVK
jgi:hypothetical protein